MFFSALLPMWGAAFVVSLACAGVGTALVSSKRAIVTTGAGWGAFLLVCAVPWVAGLSAHAAQPLCWVFLAAGLALALRRRNGSEIFALLLASLVSAAIVGWPFLRYRGLLAYGAHGLDEWGYVITAEWLQDHSLRQLPEIAVDPMRFNWTWHVLSVRERPLIYESLACFGAGTWLAPAQAYIAYFIAVLGSAIAAFAREPGIFCVKSWLLAFLPCAALAFHPLIILPWIAGYYGGTMTTLFTALAFGAAASPEEETPRTEAWAGATLLLVGCAALYAREFLFVALAVGGGPLAVAVIKGALRHDFSALAPSRFNRRVIVLAVAILVLGTAVVGLHPYQPIGTGRQQSPLTAARHAIDLFGGTTPYMWLGYSPGDSAARDPLGEPIGLAALFVAVWLLALISWSRWKARRDMSVPWLALIAAGVIAQAFWDELIMAKTLAIFGIAFLAILAAASADLRHRWLGLAAAVLCAFAGVRSAPEARQILRHPFIMATTRDVGQVVDGYDWRSLAYLHYLEDQRGLDWPTHLETYHAVTHFLPRELQLRVAQKYHVDPKASLP